jgi:hypothetical protein
MTLTYSKTESGLEVVIAPNGAAYCTQSSYSRWLGIDRTTIVKRCLNLEIVAVTDFEAGVNLFTPGQLVRTTIETTSHAQEVVLIPAKIMFRWLAKDNPELFDEVGDAGATQLLYTLAGYQIKAVEIKAVEIEPIAPRQLPPVRDVVDYMQVAKEIPAIANPIIRAALEQRLAEELGANNALLCSATKPVLAAVLAQDLGYSLKPGEDAKLGKWVRRFHEPLGKAQHGRYEVNVYNNTPELEKTVKAFFFFD